MRKRVGRSAGPTMGRSRLASAGFTQRRGEEPRAAGLQSCPYKMASDLPAIDPDTAAQCSTCVGGFVVSCKSLVGLPHDRGQLHIDRSAVCRECSDSSGIAFDNDARQNRGSVVGPAAGERGVRSAGRPPRRAREARAAVPGPVVRSVGCAPWSPRSAGRVAPGSAGHPGPRARSDG